MWAAALFALIAAVTAAAGAKNISVDDTDASIVYYSPGQAWTRHIEQEKSYELYNNSDSFTSVLGATATLAFNGTYIEYWSNTGPYHGPCAVQVDGKNYGNVSSNAASTGAPVIIFALDGLAEDNEHTIVVRAAAPAYPNVCEIDRFLYTSVRAASSTGTSGVPSTGSSSDSEKKGGTPWAAIGGAIGGAAVLFLLSVALFISCRKRSKHPLLEVDRPKESPDPEPTLPVITPMSEPASPFAPRPFSVSSTSPYAVQISPGLVMPATARHNMAYDRTTVQMPLAHPYESRRHNLVHGPDSTYDSSPNSPAPSTTTAQPLLSRNSTHSSQASPSPLVTAPAGTRPLSPGRPQFVLSVASELGEPEESTAPETKIEKTMEASRVGSRSASSTAASSSAPAPPLPVVQHIDAGSAPEPSVVADELPPAYNEQWHSG